MVQVPGNIDAASKAATNMHLANDLLDTAADQIDDGEYRRATALALVAQGRCMLADLYYLIAIHDKEVTANEPR